MTAKKELIISCLLGAIILSGCTEPGESTGIGAAAGGAIGAGLGAIIGSQTGDAGAGLAIGATAGAASGALVGNALDMQQEAIRTQDEAIERQDRLLAAQKTELEDLRRLKDDSYSGRSAKSNYDSQNNLPSSARGRLEPPTLKSVRESNLAPSTDEARIHRETLLYSGDADKPDPGYKNKPLTQAPVLPDSNKTARIAPAAPVNFPNTKECKSAKKEYEQAQAVSEGADKLFHMRRALRLCPDSAYLHYELGRLYQKINRNKDAEFEFKEALSVDPSFSPAQRAVASSSAKSPKGREY